MKNGKEESGCGCGIYSAAAHFSTTVFSLSPLQLSSSPSRCCIPHLESAKAGSGGSCGIFGCGPGCCESASTISAVESATEGAALASPPSFGPQPGATKSPCLHLNSFVLCPFSHFSLLPHSCLCQTSVACHSLFLLLETRFVSHLQNLPSSSECLLSGGRSLNSVFDSTSITPLIPSASYTQHRQDGKD